MNVFNKILLGIIACVLIAPFASAAPPVSYPVGYTPIFDNTTDHVIVNATYRWNDDPTTPAENLYLYVISAIVLSVLGYRLACEYCTVLAIMFSSMAIYAAQAVDFVYYGVTSQQNLQGTSPVFNYVSMALHNVTPMPNMMITMGVILCLSILNLYRIYLLYKTADLQGVGGSGRPMQ